MYLHRLPVVQSAPVYLHPPPTFVIPSLLYPVEKEQHAPDIRPLASPPLSVGRLWLAPCHCTGPTFVTCGGFALTGYAAAASLVLARKGLDVTAAFVSVGGVAPFVGLPAVVLVVEAPLVVVVVVVVVAVGVESVAVGGGAAVEEEEEEEPDAAGLATTEGIQRARWVPTDVCLPAAGRCGPSSTPCACPRTLLAAPHITIIHQSLRHHQS